MTNYVWLELLIAAGLLLLTLGVSEVGFRVGRRAKAKVPEADSPQLGTVQGAILGLLGLLLGFSFAAAGGRFIERHDLIVAEANAIGTASLRADLFDEPYRGQYRKLLRDYTTNRMAMFNTTAARRSEELHSEAEALYQQMWRVAVAGVRQTPQFDKLVLPPLNDVIDLHTTRQAALNRHIPIVVLMLLVACSALAIGTMGYGCGFSGRRQLVLLTTLSLLVTATLWITIDLDYPRIGLISLGQEPLENLYESFEANAKP